MTNEEKEYLRQWLDKAEHDLIAAKSLIELRPLILDIACFHCQQAIEKYLKSFLVYNRIAIIKTHDIVLLQKKCSEIDSDFSGVDFKNLNEFAVEVRYPDNFLSPALSEANEYLTMAEQIKEIVLIKIRFD